MNDRLIYGLMFTFSFCMFVAGCCIGQADVKQKAIDVGSAELYHDKYLGTDTFRWTPKHKALKVQIMTRGIDGDWVPKL